jgi:ribosomal protein S18 acetylase RimI-like enzyme
MPAILEPLEFATADVASVPRRFGVGVMLILTTAFALLFSLMRTLGAPPQVFLLVAGLFLAVTLAQILLFEGKKPRQASLWAGGVFFPLEVLIVGICSMNMESHQSFEGELGGMVCVSIFFGAPLGYLAGCLLASVFLAQEALSRRSIQPVQIELAPFAADDFEVLMAWVRHAPLFEAWSNGRFRYPLDRKQLAVHLDPAILDAVILEPDAQVAAAPEIVELSLARPSAADPGPIENQPPVPLCFKAVCGEMRQMVGFVELANIDAQKHSAKIDLAIVDPFRNDRDHLSRALVREAMRLAFNQQGLKMLRVVGRRTAAETLGFYRSQGFYDIRMTAGILDAIGEPELALLVKGDPDIDPQDYQVLVRSDRY